MYWLVTALAALSVFLLVMGLGLVVGVFAFWSLDPATWNPGGRGAVAAVSAVVACGCAGAAVAGRVVTYMEGKR